MGLSLRIQYKFDMIHGVYRNRIYDTEFLAVSLQEGIQSGFIVSNLLLLTLNDIIVTLIHIPCLFVCLIDFILYVPPTIFQLNRDGSSWVEPVLS